MWNEGAVVVHDVNRGLRVLEQGLEAAEAALHQLEIRTQESMEKNRDDAVVQEDFVGLLLEVVVLALTPATLGQRSQGVNGMNGQLRGRRRPGERGFRPDQFDEPRHDQTLLDQGRLLPVAPDQHVLQFAAKK